METNSLKDKVILITGGATGIGFASGALYLRKGAKVIIAGRNNEQGEKAVQQLQQISEDIKFITADISNSSSVQNLIEKTVAHFGRLDVAFNNAGTEGSFLPIDEADEEDMHDLINTNIKGSWLSIKYQIIQFKKQRTGGVIVNTSSWLSHGAMAGSGTYSASKAALDGLIRAVAIEAAPFNIRINNVNPGYIVTPMFRRFMDPEGEVAKSILKQAPVGRFGQPSEIAELVVFLSSDAASFITGQCISADGGLAIGGQRN